MATDENQIEYWLATTAVQITGTRTTTRYSHTAGAPVVTHAATATQTLRADRSRRPVRFDVAHSLLAKSQSTLKFTDDGRLAGADETSTGQGASVLTTAAKLVGVLAQATVHAFAAMPEADSGGTDGAVPFPEADTLAALANQRVALDEVIAAIDVSGGDADARERLDYLDRAIKLTQTRYVALTAAAKAWDAATDSVDSESHAFVIDAKDLPTEAELRAGQLEDPAHAAWETLGVMATLPAYDFEADPDPLKNEGGVEEAPYGQDASFALWYRRPRRTELSTWTRDASGQPALVGRTPVEIIDHHCRHFSIHMDAHSPLAAAFASDELALTFGAAGTPTSIGSQRNAGFADALGALAGLPDGFTAGATSAAKAAALFAPPDPVAQEIATLSAQKKLLTLRAQVASMS